MQGCKLFVNGKLSKIYSDGKVIDPPAYMFPTKRQNSREEQLEQLKLLCLNVNGLDRKISDVEFLEFLFQYDIILLQETWLSKNTNINLDLQGYIGVHMYGNKSPYTNKGRYSGGLTLYFRHF